MKKNNLIEEMFGVNGRMHMGRSTWQFTGEGWPFVFLGLGPTLST